MHNQLIEKLLSAIKTIPADKLTKKDLLTEQFLIEKDEHISMYYAPHNEYINKEAKIVIVGITPGWNQMKIAFETFVKYYSSGNDLDACLYEAKIAARFAGTMRMNLCNMLDECGIPEALNIHHSSDLFEPGNTLLHTTSIIKYPVFIKGKNYTGHQPPIDQSQLLKRYAYEEFKKELSKIKLRSLIIPLGKTVEKVLHKIKDDLPEHEYLISFPHPSGANGHRKKQFLQQKDQLQQKIKSWAEKKDIV